MPKLLGGFSGAPWSPTERGLDGIAARRAPALSGNTDCYLAAFARRPVRDSERFQPIYCPRRKIRCSGEWPACSACAGRKRVCIYTGLPPPNDSPRATLPSHSDIQPEIGRGELPSKCIRKKIISSFREMFTPTFFNFIPPQQLIEDDIGDNLPLSLLLCITALVSRSLPELSSGQTSFHAGDHYADLARRELASTYEEPSLNTIQCCLILCVYEIGEGCEHRGWLRLGHAAKLAQLLQLHKQDTNLGLMDWGHSASPLSPAVSESKRRTFWCCFCLERLLANGRDRIVTFSPEDITTQFPQSDENFIYGHQVRTCTLNCPDWSSETHSHDEKETVMGYTIRIIHALSQVIAWNGRGGRHVDTSYPWLSDTAFNRLNEALKQWVSVLPTHLKYSPQNTSAMIALGKGKLWSIMWMVYFQARAYLHREYLPFTPQEEYDPSKGPSDGPALLGVPPKDFWRNSATAMIESANAISNLYQTMKTRGLSASAYPIPGLGLLTAASIHAVYSLFSWDSMRDVISPEESLSYLKQDMDAFNDIGQKWCLAIHWMRQISLFYKLNLLTKQSQVSSNENNIASMNVKEIKDGIMNFVRQISLKDRQTRDVNLKPTFDFDGWMNAMESSVDREQRMELEGEADSAESQSLPTTYVDDLQSFGLLNNGSGMFYLDGLAEMGLSGDVESLVEEWDHVGLE